MFEGVWEQRPPVYIPSLHEDWARMRHPDRKRFTVVVRKWEVTPGQVVFGLRMREGYPGELRRGPLGPDNGDCRLYPVHTSRYIMALEEQFEPAQGGFRKCVRQIWKINLDLQVLSIPEAKLDPKRGGLVHSRLPRGSMGHARLGARPCHGVAPGPTDAGGGSRGG